MKQLPLPAGAIFGKEPGQMNDWEATILAGIPNAPSAYSLDASPELAAQRQKQVLERMLRCAKITEEKVELPSWHKEQPGAGCRRKSI